MKSFLRFRISGIAVAAIAALAIGVLPALGVGPSTVIGTDISTSGTLNADGNTTLGAYTNNLSTASAALFVDTDTDRVGIGTITPGANLQVVSSTHSTGTPVFQVYNSQYDDNIFSIQSKGRAMLNAYDDYTGAGPALSINQYGVNAGDALYVEQHGAGVNAGPALEVVQDNHAKSSMVVSGGLIYLNNNSDAGVYLATGTSDGTVSIGGGNGSIMIDSAIWGIDSTGNATGFTSLGASGTITGGTLTDGTATLTGGNISGAGTIGAITFNGALTGDVTGDVSGNASTATALQTARTINGVSFDGTADITIPATSQDYAMFYGLTAGTGNGGPTDYAATVAAGAPVPFPRIGPAFGNITASSATEFTIHTVGTYDVSFNVHTTEPGQLEVAVNDGGGYLELPQCTGEDMNPTAGGHPIVGNCIITTTVTDELIEVVNPSGNATALTITPADGSETHANAQTLTIKKL